MLHPLLSHIENKAKQIDIQYSGNLIRITSFFVLIQNRTERSLQKRFNYCNYIRMPMASCHWRFYYHRIALPC